MKHVGVIVGLLATAAGLLVPGEPVRASGDDSCYPAWRLAATTYDCAGRIMLSPGNDSRLNLFLLLRSRGVISEAGLAYPPHDFEERGFAHNFLSWDAVSAIYFPQPKADASADTPSGSRCDSAASGAQAFAAALAADRTIAAAERAALGTARAGLSPGCDTAPAHPAPVWPTGITSGDGAAFLAYLKGADSFYRGDWGAARGLFASLVRARQRWVAETSAYMLIRVELGAAIAADYDKYGDFGGPAQADHAAATRARAAIATYLQLWPQGLYAASARGLERRALWLAGDQAGLARAYETVLAQTPASSSTTVALINEVDDKLLTQGGADQLVDTPLLLATLDLMRMRSAVAQDGTRSAARLPADALAAQRPHFATAPALFAFLQAAHAYYLDRSAKAVLALAPATGPQTSFRPLEFSSSMLRGMALADLHDPDETAYWRGLLGGATALYQRPTVELALARNFEITRRIGAAFAAGSPLTEPELRAMLLQHDAGPGLLRALAHGAGRNAQERDIAAFTLLWKELSRGRYADFLSDLGLVHPASPAQASTPEGSYDTDASGAVPLAAFTADIPSDGYPCPKLAHTVASLARNPAAPKAMLCLGDFYRGGMGSFPALDSAAPADELGSGPGDFPGSPNPRGVLYERVIADPRAAPPEKAYALFRAVNCYAPSGNNDCGGADVPKVLRRAWFERLKHNYADSSWAKSLRYYW